MLMRRTYEAVLEHLVGLSEAILDTTLPNPEDVRQVRANPVTDSDVHEDPRGPRSFLVKHGRLVIEGGLGIEHGRQIRILYVDEIECFLCQVDVLCDSRHDGLTDETNLGDCQDGLITEERAEVGCDVRSPR
jgi:hypothetical protein